MRYALNSNAQQISAYATALDEFVNAHAGIHVECESEAEFINELNKNEVQVTHCDTSADPVFVYLHNNKFVAWYDEELQYGCIAQ